MGCFTFKLALSIRATFGTKRRRSWGAATGTDLFVGRNTYGMLAALGLEEITVDYVVIDTLRVPRETFATILEAWRDGYAEIIGETTSFTEMAARAYFDEMIANVRNPLGYALWLVPVVSARIPGGATGATLPA